MTDGHVWIIDAVASVQPNVSRVIMKAQFRETGGIWSICGVNQDTELALGTISGVHIVVIESIAMKRIDEHYLKSLNIWNVQEYDTNKLAVTCWTDANIYLIDRNNSKSLVKPDVIVDSDKKNINSTDLLPLPNYHPQENPFFIKRSKNSV
jgi:hypothetical protein